MLLLSASSSKPRRIQGSYVSEEEAHRLVAHWKRQAGDPAYLDAVTPALRSYVDALGRQIGASHGLLDRERYSSDIPLSVYGLHSQAVAWQGLRAIAADNPVAYLYT